jgi:hypothetical protein
MTEKEIDGEKIAEQRNGAGAGGHFPGCEERSCSIVAAQDGVFFSGQYWPGCSRGVEALMRRMAGRSSRCPSLLEGFADTIRAMTSGVLYRQEV